MQVCYQLEVGRGAYLDILLRLLPRKRATISQQIDKANSNTPIDIQDRHIRGRSDFFDSQGIVEERMGGEVFDDISLTRETRRSGLTDLIF